MAGLVVLLGATACTGLSGDSVLAERARLHGAPLERIIEDYRRHPMAYRADCYRRTLHGWIDAADLEPALLADPATDPATR